MGDAKLTIPSPTASSKAARLSRCIGVACRRVTRGPGVGHSALYGALAGLASYGGYYGFRAVKLMFFDTETVAHQSRERYAEAQKLYQDELSTELAAGHIAHFVAEYDPVATRMPFQPLDPKYLF
eukprot:GHVT01000636.1.p1 GENE.GHVT01000636.1~~GHVT01000636.1.p1  ORF type:complete len:125 (+),score=2.15 GHVT01000636.1:456-830(+)